MEWAVTPDELKPVTIDDVISPVPMNPSCMSVSCRFKAVARTDLERSSKKARIYLSAFYPTTGEGLTSRVVDHVVECLNHSRSRG